MKSYFSRFLHITLSYSGLTQISRWKKFATWFDLDHRVKPDGDRKGKDASLKPDDVIMENIGRSMVEMLGVLAIIGVLSVGAISGYSKAMFKYKLNKHAESFSTLINNAIQIGPDLSRAFTGATFSNDLFYKLGLVPDGMTYQNGKIYDVFKNEILVKYFLEPVYHQNEYYITWYMDRANNTATQRSIDICRNIVIAAKENAANITSVQVRSSTDGGYSEVWLRGDLNPGNGTNLLRNAGVNEIDKFCNTCNSETMCRVMILFKA